jgi:hypothetical protein
MATPAGYVVPSDGDVFVAGLAQGSRWDFGGGPRVLTYSLHSDELSAPFAAGWRDVVARALAAWSDVADIRFAEIEGGEDARASPADLAISLWWDEGAWWAGTGYPPDPWAVGAELYEEGLSRLQWPRPEGDVLLNLASPLMRSTQPGGSALWVTVHEIGHALGLKHPFDDGGAFRPDFATLGIASYDDSLWTVMSYEALGLPRGAGSPATPMPLDVHVVQSLYGANRTHRAGDDAYALVADGVMRTLWDAGGIDTLDASMLGQEAQIDLRPGEHSYHGSKTTPGLPYTMPAISVTAIAWGVDIEHAIGSPRADSIRGNALDNRLAGGGGVDLLWGFAGDDQLAGGAGDDWIDGGEGRDVATFAAAREAYTVLLAPDGALAVGHRAGGADGVDELRDVESMRFADGALAREAADSAMEYLASWPDLAAAFGLDAQSGFAHFVAAGYAEGRALRFDGLEYLASYADLTAAFGIDAARGTEHFITLGRAEGRAVAFDGRDYIASYDDLIAAFGLDAHAAALHYISIGRSEGRAVTFDGLQYIASHGDLIAAFGLDAQRGTTHFVTTGLAEGRSRDAFDAQQYLANYADLQQAFGNGLDAATRHFVAHGYAEGRTDQAFG